ncbi:MAG: hypothetical protein K0R65_1139 [Crocinitomicaceae bacterium]|jgi:hypothetical protein|nr:hypothetical protein [Crocinitomicaceae bacterium]
MLKTFIFFGNPAKTLKSGDDFVFSGDAYESRLPGLSPN